jgi:hypothetical protein
MMNQAPTIRKMKVVYSGQKGRIKIVSTEIQLSFPCLSFQSSKRGFVVKEGRFEKDKSLSFDNIAKQREV